MPPSLLNQGLVLMLVGMGTVFVFLTVLVGAMSLMALVVNRFLPSEADMGASDEEIAVITTAIAQHRKSHP